MRAAIRSKRSWGSMAAIAGLAPMLVTGLARAADAPARPVAHEEMGRALEELTSHVRGLGTRWRDHFSGGEARWPERPLISIMLGHRDELGLSGPQVDALERLRGDFQREVIRRDADIRVAEMDLAALLRGAGPVDLAQAEAKVRELERLRADLRVARLRTIEQGKAQLSAEQRQRLEALLADGPPSSRMGGGSPRQPLLPGPGQRL
jgi:Spy/CpxP family protein refolding chaperone